ncbi:MAG: hypothetical protein MSS55_02750 [Ruminococcus sp.]|nr:hypothetical protein [Ruminococcus sp.]
MKRLSREIIIQRELVDAVYLAADNTEMSDKGEDIKATSGLRAWRG